MVASCTSRSCNSWTRMLWSTKIALVNIKIIGDLIQKGRQCKALHDLRKVWLSYFLSGRVQPVRLDGIYSNTIYLPLAQIWTTNSWATTKINKSNRQPMTPSVYSQWLKLFFDLAVASQINTCLEVAWNWMLDRKSEKLKSIKQHSLIWYFEKWKFPDPCSHVLFHFSSEKIDGMIRIRCTRVKWLKQWLELLHFCTAI